MAVLLLIVSRVRGWLGTRAEMLKLEHLQWFGIGVCTAGVGLAAYQLLLLPVLAGPVSSLPPRPTAIPLRVEVTGEVTRPGTLSMPPSARVQDAITQAGGLTALADGSRLNLAARLSDGQRIVVPRQPWATATAWPTRTPRLTATPWPTRTPSPTRTARPSATPWPTRTPRPTSTPWPTATQRPTRTPWPTRTPTADPLYAPLSDDLAAYPAALATLLAQVQVLASTPIVP